MPRKKEIEKSQGKSAQPGYATEADIERAKRIAYLLEMRYGWETKTDAAFISNSQKPSAKHSRRNGADAEPVKLYKPKKPIEGTSFHTENNSVGPCGSRRPKLHFQELLEIRFLDTAVLGN